MERLKRDALVLKLIAKLKEGGSWSGETHIQKAVYFLQTLFEVRLGFDFILYKYGPFSFDLRDALTALRADGLLDIRPQEPYGPSLFPSEAGLKFPDRFPRIVKEYEKQLEFIGTRLGNRKVQELERLATALYVSVENSRMGVNDRAMLVHRLKPHVQVEDAKAALEEVERITEETREVA